MFYNPGSRDNHHECLRKTSNVNSCNTRATRETSCRGRKRHGTTNESRSGRAKSRKCGTPV
eukprot:2860477-Amphidinium_carterae.1